MSAFLKKESFGFSFFGSLIGSSSFVSVFVGSGLGANSVIVDLVSSFFPNNELKNPFFSCDGLATFPLISSESNSFVFEVSSSF